MSDVENGLPKFRKPPVVETVLAVFFRPKFNSAHLGVLWDRHFRDRFPNLEERPPVEEEPERFGEDRLAEGPAVRWRVMDQPDVARLWATSKTDEHVVQFQRNAFLANWLKTGDDTSYRDYVDRREEFRQQLECLDRFAVERELGPIEPTSCWVTYVNHIDYEGMDQIGPALARLLACWTNETSDGWLPNPDNVVVNWGFPMPDQSGRLRVQLRPIARRNDKKEMLRLELSARSSAQKREIGEALAWIDLGHKWVVRGFASLTRPEMHRLWERIQ
ncbi:MAG: TIGR04255 family protein [Thermoguttaceae bacterium]|jgi:uncharacterized protein (TIGR04255 family)|nr:TIGR04255 family protein [Thermoguttaceae bacterium]